jgi:hypothetical protein
MTREIKTIGKCDYVYESPMEWDPDPKKRHKVSKYGGKVINGDKENPMKVREIVAVRGIYEIGHIELAWSLVDDVISLLRKEYPEYFMKILAFSFNRLIYPLPMKSLKSWIEKTMLS